MSLAQEVRALMERRSLLAAEIDAIDSELEQARASLGIPLVTDRDEVLGQAIRAILARNGPTTLKALTAETGRSLHKVHTVIRMLSDQIELTGNTNRRIARLKTDSRAAPAYDPPDRPTRVLASRTEDRVCAWRDCGKTFTPAGGSSGTFCSRECYYAAQRSHRTPPVAPPLAPAEPDAPAADPVALMPRCERCGVSFEPTLGTSGRFCSRACYERPNATQGEHDARIVEYVTAHGECKVRQIARALELDVQIVRDRLAVLLDAKTLEALGNTSGQVVRVRRAPLPRDTATPPAVTALPERRCGRCMHRFRPTSDTQYVCATCVKPAVPPADPEPELETKWRPSKDAPSLSGEGLGSSLAGEHRSLR